MSKRCWNAWAARRRVIRRLGAYFPVTDINDGALQRAHHESTHPDLGKTTWFDVFGGDGQIVKRGA